MRIVNVHARPVARPVAEVGALLELLGGPDDAIWPGDVWPPMKLDQVLSVGSRGGHGPIRYTVVEHDERRRVRFGFRGPRGLRGWHELSVEDHRTHGSYVSHRVELDVNPAVALQWHLVIGPLHDALLEDALDRLEGKPQRAWSVQVRALRRAFL